MIDVGPNKSAISHIGVGQLENQVQDLGIAQNALHQQAQLAYADKKDKEAARIKQQEDLLNLAATNTSGIKPADQPYFVGEADKLNKLIYDAIDPKTGGMSTANKLKAIQQANKIKMEAELSKNQRERIEAESNKFDPTKHDAEDLAALHTAYTTPKSWDTFQPLQENIDLTKDTRENLLPIVEKHINTNERGKVEFTEPQAVAMLSSRYDTNPLIRAQAIKNYRKNNPTGEVTVENVKNNYVETQKPHLLQSKTTYAPQSNTINVGGVATKAENLPAAYHSVNPQTGVGFVTLGAPVKNGQENKIIRNTPFNYPTSDGMKEGEGEVHLVGWRTKNGQISRGEGLALTPDQAKKNQQTRKEYNDKYSKWYDLTGGDEVIAAANNLPKPEMGNLLEPTKKVFLAPGEVRSLVKLDYNADADAISRAQDKENDKLIGGAKYSSDNRYKDPVNATKPKEEATPSGAKVWNGHSYTLDEIKMMGKSAGKSDAEIMQLWKSLK